MQAEKLDEMLASVGEKLDEVIDLEVNPEEILVRLTGAEPVEVVTPCFTKR